VPTPTDPGTTSVAVVNVPAFRDPDTDSDVPTVADSGTVSVTVEKLFADRVPVTVKSPSNSDSAVDPSSFVILRMGSLSSVCARKRRQ